MTISHDRFFLDRICTHMLAFKGDAHVELFEGDLDGYEATRTPPRTGRGWRRSGSSIRI